MTNTRKVTTGILVGAVVGATLGLLFAPKKGTKTRALIAEKVKEVGSSASSGYNKAKDMLGMTRKKEEVAKN